MWTLENARHLLAPLAVAVFLPLVPVAPAAAQAGAPSSGPQIEAAPSGDGTEQHASSTDAATGPESEEPDPDSDDDDGIDHRLEVDARALTARETTRRASSCARPTDAPLEELARPPRA